MKILAMDLNYPNRHFNDVSTLIVIDNGIVKEIALIKPPENIVKFQQELQKQIDYYKDKYPGIKVVEEKNGINNKIEWRKFSPQAYDGSEINRIHLDGYGLYE